MATYIHSFQDLRTWVLNANPGNIVAERETGANSGPADTVGDVARALRDAPTANGYVLRFVVVAVQLAVSVVRTAADHCTARGTV